MTKPADKSAGYQAPAVHKAFHLLRTVAQSRQPFGLTGLAKKLGYSKSTTHGLVHALLREGALVQGADGRKLHLGPTVIDLAFSSWNSIKMVEAVQPVIDRLRDRIKETLVLGALICNRILILAAAESADPLKISASPGTVLPLFAGAAGKVFLAAKPPGEAQQLIRENGLPFHTPRSITDEGKYLAVLEEARSNGYCVDDEEYLTGVRAVAVALNNIKGPPMAFWAVGLSNRMDDDKIAHAIGVMTAASGKLRGILDQGPGD
ncbi:IclR family transcriptional regulator [Desulfosarcina alkanivorans]|jgi:DNA-binding IclR family transcriptional regulator|uniref:IclR family transcriptional regulator n=1 Tax=Desulfosarcina alkanivorans TaxID=571177 RepID=A0A5K7YJ50_9BACT|nr:IclR family transcriptional regulator [Desulfosarcina alkanivorans]BBO68150.1 IclR family transcriptional regulator [Desulfosarcina alkanivorans]